MVKSESMSLDGWEFGKWFKGNWSTIKEVLKVGVPATVGWVTTHDPALAGLITIVGKFLLDMGQYYITSYK